MGRDHVGRRNAQQGQAHGGDALRQRSVEGLQLKGGGPPGARCLGRRVAAAADRRVNGASELRPVSKESEPD